MIYADRTFVNGKIYTMKQEGDVAEAVVIYDGKIVFVGSNEEAKEYPTKETIDLQGKAVLPGLIETHLHLLMDCQSKERINLVNATSIDEIVDIMKKNDKGGDGWLIGTNFHIDKLKEARFPTRHDIDRIADDRPVFLISYCRHTACGNTKAMEVAGVTNEVAASMPELLDLDENGDLLGIVRESAYGQFFSDFVEQDGMDPVLRRGLLKRHFKDYAQKGFTTLHTFTSVSGDPLEYFDQYQDLNDAGEMPMRIILNPAADMPENTHPKTGLGNEKIKIGAKKFFIDGSLSAHTGALREPYSDAPDESGLLVVTPEELARQVKYSYDMGMEIAIHSIGDRALDVVLDAVEGAYDPNGPNKNKFRIIHVLMAQPDQIERMKKLPVILDTQPIFIKNWVHLLESRVGERKKYFIPYRDFFDAGLIVTGSSDAPVEVADPFIGIQCAVTSQDLTGFPEGGLVPAQRISVYEGVSMFTRNAAHCTNEENIKGTIEAGKLADMAILEQDIFEVPHSEIHKIEVAETILGGETTWTKQG